jgi:type I restriction enzyme, S subunit
VTWHTCRLGDVVTLKRGHDLPASQRQDGNVPVVSSSGITGYHSVSKEKGPGVVTGRYGTLGEVFYVDEDYWPLNTALYVTNFKGNHRRFVAYWLQHVLRNHQSDKAAVPGVNRNVLHELRVQFPDTKSQANVAAILSAFDDLIENNARRTALLEETARQLYREWFVRLRFPGHEHTPVMDGVPKGWDRKTLRDVANVNLESIGSGFDGEIEYVDIASVAPGQINETSVLEFRDAPSRARRVVRHGDIIWSCVRPNRRSHAVIWQPPRNMIVSTGFAVVTPTTLPTSIIYQAITTDAFVGYLENHARGAAYPAVVAGDFERAEILVPAEPLVEAFNDFAEPLLNQTSNLRVQNQKLRGARDLLLPRLMSGEIPA